MRERAESNSRKPYQHGIAAIEAVLVIPVLLALLAGITFFGRYTWHYTAAQKAAHDAARYLATVSQREMKTPGLGGTVAPVLQIAQNIAALETAELHPGPYPPYILVLCQPVQCTGFSVPSRVRVMIQMELTDDIFTPISQLFLGDAQLPLSVDVTLPYVGS